jgi:phospholipase/carboxylesterase
MNTLKIAGFDIIEIPAPEGSDAIIMLHGYGADYRDLAPLSAEIPVDKPYHWYFINAPFPCPGMAGFGGRMWFPIDMMGLQEAIAKNQFREFFNTGIPQGLVEARERMEILIRELHQKHSGLVIGGFSQGAMVASLAALQLSSMIKGLLILSGTFVAPSLWSDLVSEAKTFPIFQSHGEADPVLPYSEAKRLNEFLTNSGFVIQFEGFKGGHQIPYEVMDRLGAFLSHLSKVEKS